MQASVCWPVAECLQHSAAGTERHLVSASRQRKQDVVKGHPVLLKMLPKQCKAEGVQCSAVAASRHGEAQGVRLCAGFVSKLALVLHLRGAITWGGVVGAVDRRPQSNYTASSGYEMHGNTKCGPGHNLKSPRHVSCSYWSVWLLNLGVDVRSGPTSCSALGMIELLRAWTST